MPARIIAPLSAYIKHILHLNRWPSAFVGRRTVGAAHPFLPTPSKSPKLCVCTFGIESTLHGCLCLCVGCVRTAFPFIANYSWDLVELHACINSKTRDYRQILTTSAPQKLTSQPASQLHLHYPAIRSGYQQCMRMQMHTHTHGHAKHMSCTAMVHVWRGTCNSGKSNGKAHVSRRAL